jgi:hypothetical protein
MRPNFTWLKSIGLLLGVIALITIWFTSPYWVSYMVDRFLPNPPEPGWSDRGLKGDSFGAINALFGGLGLAAVAYSLIIQKSEVQASSAEMKRSAELTQKFIEQVSLLVIEQRKANELVEERVQTQKDSNRLTSLMAEYSALHGKKAAIIGRVGRGRLSDDEEARLRELHGMIKAMGGEDPFGD